MSSGVLAPDAVEAMFDRISPVYDPMNRLMTAGLDRRWRRLAVSRVVRPGDRVLDACCGTGDLALAAEEAGGTVTGLDFSERMLERARRKSSTVEWVRGDAMALPFEDGSFDAATVGFGIRNVADLDAGLRELARVLRPGGRLACLEITRPRGALQPFFRLWFDGLVPLAGTRPPRRRRLQLSAGQRAALPGSRRSRRRNAAGGLRRSRLEAPRRRDRCAPHRQEGCVSALATVRAAPGLDAYLELLEERLERSVSSHPGLVSAIGADTLSAGGKRLRPVLVFLCTPADERGGERCGRRRRRGRARPHGDARPRRPSRRRRPAARPAHGLGRARRAGCEGRRRLPLRAGLLRARRRRAMPPAWPCSRKRRSRWPAARRSSAARPTGPTRPWTTTSRAAR